VESREPPIDIDDHSGTFIVRLRSKLCANRAKLPPRCGSVLGSIVGVERNGVSFGVI